MSGKAAGKSNGGTAPASVKALPVVRLDQLMLREQGNNDWLVVAPLGVSSEDLDAPDLWIAVAHRLRAYDFIRVIAADESWLAELVVRHATTANAVLKVMRVVELGQKLSDDEIRRVPANHRIYLGAPGEGWIVERTNPDGSSTVMARGAEQGRWSYEQALRWLLDHPSLTQSARTS